MKQLFFAVIILATISACEKNETPERANSKTFVENSEEWIDGIYYVDGTAQIDRIEDLDIQGISVVDGRFKFEDTKALFDAIEVFSQSNDESRLNFYRENGVYSLLTKLDEFDKKYDNNETIELSTNVDQHYFILNENEPTIQNISYSMAQVLNQYGMVQVGEFVGAFRKDELIWTAEENAQALEKSVSKGEIPSGSEFQSIKHHPADRNWVATESCPKNSTWFGPLNQYKNPTAVRRIDVQNIWERFIIPLSNGNYDISYLYTLKSTSRKQAWNRYRTDHSHSIDIITNEVIYGSESFDVYFSKTGYHSSTMVANTQVSIIYDTNVSYGHWNSHFVRLSYTDPGSSGLEGTAATHQGMGGRYGRQKCE